MNTGSWIGFGLFVLVALVGAWTIFGRKGGDGTDAGGGDGGPVDGVDHGSSDGGSDGGGDGGGD